VSDLENSLHCRPRRNGARVPDIREVWGGFYFETLSGYFKELIENKLLALKCPPPRFKIMGMITVNNDTCIH